MAVQRTLGLICLVAGFCAATTLMTEAFDSNWTTDSPPSGWRIVYVRRAGTNDWHREPAGTSPWTRHPTPFAGIYHSTSPDSTADSLISPVLDCAGLGNITLACSTYFMRFSTGWYVAELRYSVDSGRTFPFLLKDYHAGSSSGPVLETFRLDSAENRSGTRLAWVFDGQLGHISYWYLDDVCVSADSLSGIAAPASPPAWAGWSASVIRDGAPYDGSAGATLYNASGRRAESCRLARGVYYLFSPTGTKRLVLVH